MEFLQQTRLQKCNKHRRENMSQRERQFHRFAMPFLNSHDAANLIRTSLDSDSLVDPILLNLGW